MSSKVKIYTDGACSMNPGPGGWAALLVYGEREKMISGYEDNTTNNRMELRAAIEALGALKGRQQVALWTDSTYVKQGITTWIIGWKQKGWKNAQKKPIKNQDLWVELDALQQKHQVSWHWVKGHSGHRENDMVDEAARAEIEARK
ncbi:ribonuclease HI [Gammaproteobacteria bacterium]|nr:ribonuclease HI [Gammaproteobacteria bacterium]